MLQKDSNVKLVCKPKVYLTGMEKPTKTSHADFNNDNFSKY